MSEETILELLKIVKKLRDSDLQSAKEDFGDFLKSEGDFDEGEFDINAIEDYMERYCDDEYGTIAYALGWLNAESYIIYEIERLLSERETK